MHALTPSALGTVLAVWAHPDDESYVAGALLATASDAGSRVVCVTATRGERGTAAPDRWSDTRLARTRTRELGGGGPIAPCCPTAMEPSPCDEFGRAPPSNGS